MSTNHHTPHPFAGPVTAAAFNSRLGELDAAIDTVMGAGLVEAGTTLDAQALAGQAVVPVASTNGFAVGDPVWIGTVGSGLQEMGVVDSIAAGVSLTLDANLANTHQVGEPVTRSPAEIVDARSGAATLKERLRQISLGYITTFAHGAVGDDVAVDTSALQAAIDATPSGGVLFLPRPSARYRIAAGLTINKPMTILSDGAEIHQATTTQPGLMISSSGVTINGVKLTAALSTAAASIGISATGTSAAAPLTDLDISDCEFADWGSTAVRLKWVERFRVARNRSSNPNRTHIQILSGLEGFITDNRCADSRTGSGDESYGISVSREAADSLATDPRSADIVVSGNMISGIEFYDAIDGHGSERITFANNVVRDCFNGISVGPAKNASGVETFAPLDITIVGNVLDSGVSNGSANYGITLRGASGGVGTVTEYATGVISGNLVRGYGSDAGFANGGAIRVNTARGLSISANTILEPAGMGINCFFDNADLTISGNTIIDVWGETSTIAYGIDARSLNNTAMIHGNTLGRGSKTATRVNVIGIRWTNTGCDADLGQNRMDATTQVFTSTPVVAHEFRGNRMGFFNQNGIAKPTVSGSRGGNAALANLIDQLEALGLINDSTTA